jgi:carbon starvation CstA-like protein
VVKGDVDQDSGRERACPPSHGRRGLGLGPDGAPSLRGTRVVSAPILDRYCAPRANGAYRCRDRASRVSPAVLGDRDLHLLPRGLSAADLAHGAASGLFGSIGTARQIENEADMLPVGGGSMLCEFLLGLLALLAVAVGSKGAPVAAFATGLGGVISVFGIPLQCATSLAFAAFIVIVLVVTQLLFRVHARDAVRVAGRRDPGGPEPARLVGRPSRHCSSRPTTCTSTCTRQTWRRGGSSRDRLRAHGLRGAAPRRRRDHDRHRRLARVPPVSSPRRGADHGRRARNSSFRWRAIGVDATAPRVGSTRSAGVAGFRVRLLSDAYPF